MKSSGTNGSKSSSKATVPVAGRSEFMRSSLPSETQLASDKDISPQFWTYSTMPVMVAQTFGLTTKTGKLSPGALLRQHFDQQVQGMHWREQTQQMHPVKLCRAVIPPPTTGGTSGPAFIDEIVGDKRIQEFKQGDRTGRRKVRVHALKPTFGNPTCQRRRHPPAILDVFDYACDGCTNFRNTLLKDEDYCEPVLASEGPGARCRIGVG